MVSYETAVQTIFGFSRLFGLYPYDDSNESEPKWGIRLYSIIVQTVIFFLNAKKSFWPPLRDFLFRGMFRYPWDRFYYDLYVTFFEAVALGVPLVLLLFAPYKIQRIHRRIGSYVGIFGPDGYSMVVPSAFWGSQCIIGVFMLWALCIEAPLHDLDPLTPKKWLVLFYDRCFDIWHYFIIHVYIIHFATLLEALQCLFNKLNALAQLWELETCMGIHSDLCALVEELTSVYSLSLLILLYSTVTTIIDDLMWWGYWFLLQAVFRTPTPEFPDRARGTALATHASRARIFLHLILFCIICHVAYEVSYESDKFTDSLRKAMQLRKSAYDNNKLTAYLALRPSAAVCPFSLISVDTGIIASVIAFSVSWFFVFESNWIGNLENAFYNSRPEENWLG